MFWNVYISAMLHIYFRKKGKDIDMFLALWSLLWSVIYTLLNKIMTRFKTVTKLSCFCRILWYLFLPTQLCYATSLLHSFATLTALLQCHHDTSLTFCYKNVYIFVSDHVYC